MEVLAPMMGLPGVFAQVEDGVRVAIASTTPPPSPQPQEAMSADASPAPQAAPMPHAEQPLAVLSTPAVEGSKPLADCLREAQASDLAQPVHFPPASERLNDGDRRRLQQLQARAAACGPSQWRIEGHTDAQGDPGLNRRLSLRRAQAVRAFLVKAGVDSGSIEAVGLGSDRPLQAQGPDADALNRRIEVHLSAAAR